MSKKALIILSAITLVVKGSIYAVPPDKADGWVKTWAEEFNGDKIDSLKWQMQDSEDWDEDGKICWFKRSNITLDEGCLAIENHWHKEPGPNKEVYSGGKLISQSTWRFGYFEARTRLEKNDDHFWPTFWMFSTNGRASNEFDIMEFSSWGSTPSQSHHFPNKDGKSSGVSGKPVHKWGEWAVLWSEDDVIFYVNGKKQFSSSGPERAARDDLPIWLTCSPDMNNHPRRSSSAYPRFMIDWVRVWQKIGTTVSLMEREKLIPYESMVVFKSFKGDRFLQAAVGDGLENEQLKVAGPKDENTLSFRVDDLDDGMVSLRLAPKIFLHVDHTNDFRVYANHDYDDVRQEFEWIPQKDGTMAIKALVNDKYVSIDSDTGFLHADAEKIGEFEKFKYDIK